MIYKLESGVDNEIREKIITAALILTTTIGVPALAAVVNKVSPFEGILPGSSVLGASSEEDETEAGPGGTAARGTANGDAVVSSEKDSHTQRGSQTGSHSLKLESTSRSSSPNSLDETCACPDPGQPAPNPVGGAILPDKPPTGAEPDEEDDEPANINLEVGVEDLDVKAEVNIDEKPDASLEVEL